MPSGLRRYYGNHDFHFITCSCYHRRPVLSGPSARDLFVRILEETRFHYHFVVVGYVVMPEHFHLLVSEPDRGTPSTVMQVLKQRFARELHKMMNPDSDPTLSQSTRKDGHPRERMAHPNRCGKSDFTISMCGRQRRKRKSSITSTTTR
jgi:REP element-mobilizing transposase RayT